MCLYACSDMSLIHVFIAHGQYANTLYHRDLAKQQLNVHAQIPCDRGWNDSQDFIQDFRQGGKHSNCQIEGGGRNML